MFVSIFVKTSERNFSVTFCLRLHYVSHNTFLSTSISIIFLLYSAIFRSDKWLKFYVVELSDRPKMRKIGFINHRRKWLSFEKKRKLGFSKQLILCSKNRIYVWIEVMQYRHLLISVGKKFFIYCAKYLKQVNQCIFILKISACWV